MKLFDLHCDTLTEIEKKQEGIVSNSSHVSLDKAFQSFDDYTQVMAIWSRNDLSDDENFRNFAQTLAYGRSRIEGIEKFHPIYSVEGGKLLAGKIDRLKVLAENGIKILTLVWQDECCIGGAWNTDKGLTDFGRDVVNACYDYGIIPDVSHSSDEMFYETAEIAAVRGGTVIASHSCSRAICPHPRNLTDDMARTISELGGVIGVNLVSDHLGEASIDKVCSHIIHLSHIAGDDKICLGCDLDGTDKLPTGIENVKDVVKINDALVKLNCSGTFIDGVFCSNAQRFANEHFAM